MWRAWKIYLKNGKRYLKTRSANEGAFNTFWAVFLHFTPCIHTSNSSSHLKNFSQGHVRGHEPWSTSFFSIEIRYRLSMSKSYTMHRSGLSSYRNIYECAIYSWDTFSWPKKRYFVHCLFLHDGQLMNTVTGTVYFVNLEPLFRIHKFTVVEPPSKMKKHRHWRTGSKINARLC